MKMGLKHEYNNIKVKFTYSKKKIFEQYTQKYYIPWNDMRTSNTI